MHAAAIKSLAFGIFTPSLFLQAAAYFCDSNDGFVHFNSSKTVPLPALRINGTSVVDDPDNSWSFSVRTQYSGADDEAMTYMWLNTGKSNATGIGTCWQTTWTYDLHGFMFSRDVLERSVDDKGDCKVMLGEECVAGLIRHYQRSATQSVLEGSCSGASFNATIPQECASLVGGGSTWRAGLFGASADLNYALDKETLKEEGCPNSSVAVNSSIHGGSGTGGGYNQMVRFPQPYFLAFWPNRTGELVTTGVSSEDVHVELLCLRTDEIEKGSPVPGSAQNILDEAGVKYEGNATDKPSESGSESPGPTGGAVAIKTMAPYWGAAAIAGLLLV